MEAEQEPMELTEIDQPQPQQQQQPQPMNESTDDNDNILKTPAKAPKIPRDESFKTCKTDMPAAAARRQLRMTPARTSILSGGQPFKEVTSSGKRFNSRKKARGGNGSRLNETGGSNETFVRHEQDLQFDRDSLDTNPPSVHRHRISSTPKPTFQPAVVPKPKLQLERQQPLQLPQPKFKAPIARPLQKPFNRFVTPRHNTTKNNVSSRYFDSARQSTISKKANSSGITRAQSFKSTAELEREYFSSLRSRV